MSTDIAMANTQEPNPTVYVRNLPEHVKIPDLVDRLQEIFGMFGTVIDIVAKSSLKRKGQAFVVFDNVASAKSAIEEIQGFEIAGKPMRLEYARTKSDATVKREGTEDDFEHHKRRRLAEKERKQAMLAAEAQKLAGHPTTTGGTEPARPRPKTGAAVIPDEFVPPNKVLFVQNLPKDVTVDVLTGIFSQFEGFKEIRTVPGRAAIAFVEYNSEQEAITAKESTANMAVGADQKPMKVTYQRQ